MNTAHAGLSPNSKLPLTLTKSAPDSLVIEQGPARKPDVISSASSSGVVPGSCVITAHSGQKPVSELPAARPSKCK